MNTNTEKSMFTALNLEAFASHDGVVYRIEASDLEGMTWADDVQSSWFVCSLVSKAKAKFGAQLGRDATLQLCAAILKSTVEQLEQTLEWNAQYLAWHDGGSPSECHVWP